VVECERRKLLVRMLLPFRRQRRRAEADGRSGATVATREQCLCFLLVRFGVLVWARRLRSHRHIWMAGMLRSDVLLSDCSATTLRR
jgi:hypothetical protein